MNVKRDLPERTFEFAGRIVKLCQVLDQTPGVSRSLANQLPRAGTSIGANVEEGHAGQSRADFTNTLAIACSSTRGCSRLATYTKPPEGDWKRVLLNTPVGAFQTLPTSRDGLCQL